MKKYILTVLLLLLLILISVCYGSSLQYQQLSVLQMYSGGGVACSPTYDSELQTDANAAEPDASDTNATTGLTNYTLETFESTTTNPSLGTYHINAVADSINDRFVDVLTGLTDGVAYRISFDVAHNGTGNNWACRIADQTSSSDKILLKALTSADTTYSSVSAYFIKTADLDHLQCIATTDTGGVLFDNYSVKAITSPCLGGELHTSENAASLSNEASAVTGFTVTGIDTFESVSTDTPQAGTYHLHIREVDTPTGSARIYMDIGTLFSLQEGVKYYLTFWGKTSGLAAATWRMGFSTSTTSIDNGKIIGTLTDADTSYKKQGVSFTYTSGSHRYFTIMENNVANTGELWIDSLSIKEVVSE